jgi:PAS domain S-box-containing protein
MGDPRGGTGWERLFWLVFERTSNPVALLDESRRIVELNPAAAALLGGTREQLIGTSLRDRLGAEQGERADAAWRDFLRTGEYAGTRDLVKTDGSEVHVDFAARMADIGGRRMAIYVALAGGEPEETAIARGAANLGLTDREREVVTLIAMGLDTGDIAGELHISPETVRTHVRNAMSKLNVHTRAQLVAVVLCGEQATLHDGHVGRS